MKTKQSKLISNLFLSKEIEHIAWLNIIHYCSFDDIRNIIIFPYKNDKCISMIYCSLTEHDYYTPEENYIHVFGFKNTYVYRPDIIIGSGSVSIKEYEMFKNDEIKYGYKFSDGIEVIREDVPEIYKLLK